MADNLRQIPIEICGATTSARLLDDQAPVACQNCNSFLHIGTINYVAANGELILCYDQAQARSGDGNQWVARIADFEGDSSALFAHLARTQHHGATSIGISRVGR